MNERRISRVLRMFVFKTPGECPVCEREVIFKAERESRIDIKWYGGWFRDALRCLCCGSLPRDRALYTVIERYYPNWRSLAIHESSSAGREISRKLRADCYGYIGTQYDTSTEFGKYNPKTGYRSEDLEKQTFLDEVFDIVITQDVFEHLFRPDIAIREIERTLKVGGAYIMTVPLANRNRKSERRAIEADGIVSHLKEPQYHGNPVSAEGSLVTIDWGNDILEYIGYTSGLISSMVQIEDMSRGIVGNHVEVFICKKSSRCFDI